MPATSKQLRAQLGLNNKTYGYIPETIINILPTWHKIGKPSPLFVKIEDETVEMLRKKYAGQQEVNGVTSTINKTSDDSIVSLEAAITKQVGKSLFHVHNVKIVFSHVVYFLRAIWLGN
jgi:methionyl-tRNA synthetase